MTPPFDGPPPSSDRVQQPAPVPESESGARDSLDGWDDLTCIGNRCRRCTGAIGQCEAQNGPDLGDPFLRRRHLHDPHLTLSD
ncbi:hypothetical protein BJY59DRAFT_698137 [Rhodotorula toruloides]